MLKINLFLLFILSFKLYSQAPDSIRFDHLDERTDARALFINTIINKDLTQYREENGNVLTALQMFEKNKETRYGGEARMHGGNPYEKKRPVIGKVFVLELYSDDVYTLDKLTFERFVLFSDLKNKLIGYELLNTRESGSLINDFIRKYAQYTSKTDKNKQIDLYIFTMKDREIVFIIDKQNNYSEARVAVPGEIHEEKTDGIKNVRIVTIFKSASKDQQEYLWRLVSSYL